MSQNYLQLNREKTDPFDPMLSFDQHVKSITRTVFFHLRNIAKIRPMLAIMDTETLLHTFISSRLDYCNPLFSG